MAENTKYQGFTVGLALVDAIPVLVFGASMILIGIAFGSPLFLVGAGLMFLGGVLKVLWKLIVAAANKDIEWMNKQFRFTMIGGFLLMIIAVIINWKKISWAAVGASIISLPSVIFFAVGLAAMVTMGVLASKLDSTDVKSNWIEQSVNSVGQICIFLGILFATVL